MKTSVLFHTLGCRLNQADSALLLRALESEGFEVLPENGEAEPDWIIVNTCAVTAIAVQKSQQALRKLKRLHPQARIAVTGCSAKAEPELWRKMPEVALLLTPDNKTDAGRILREFDGLSALSAPPRTKPENGLFKEETLSCFPFKSRAYLKVQDGCNQFCSYCIVPYARGRERSRDPDEIFADFRQLLKAGHREIVLTGVNTGRFRSAQGGLPELVETLLREPGEFRIRLSSAEPDDRLADLADLMNRYPGKLCRFLHIPAQHLDDGVLRRMNRPYTFEDYRARIEKVRASVPNLHVGTDLIVGFPGETETEFETLLERFAALDFANTHVFSYSVRPGTRAASFPDRVKPEIAAERHARLAALAREKARKYARANEGMMLPVLLEKSNPETGEAEGWSDNYLRVRTHLSAPAPRGAIVMLPYTVNDMTETDDE